MTVLKILFLLGFVIQNSLNSDNFESLKQSGKPLVVRFSSEHFKNSVRLNFDWETFSEQYRDIPNVTIAYINCGKYRRLCLKENEWEPPAIHLYMNNQVHIYDGGMSHDSLNAWLANKTGLIGNSVQSNLLSPNNKTWHQLFNQKSCIFTLFYEDKFKEKEELLNEMKITADAFQREKDVAVCEINIHKFRSFFFDFKIRKTPRFQLNVNNEEILYEGHCNAKDMVSFINSYCDKMRTEKGTLNQNAGIIEEFQPTVIEFLKSPSEKQLKSLLTKESANVYIDIMKSILDHDVNWIYKESERLQHEFDALPSGSIPSDDEIIRFNVISEFISLKEDNKL